MDGSDRLLQGMLDFENGSPEGLEGWRRERAVWLTAAREIWGWPIGRRMRVSLVGLSHELTGRLELCAPPAAMDRRRPLELRVNGVRFLSSEIERCEVRP